MNMLLKSGRPSKDRNKLLDKLDSNQTMKMNINITKSFHKEVKRYALEQDITVTDLIHQALHLYMKR